MANVYDAASRKVGEVYPNGIVYDTTMQVVGVVEFNGRVLNREMTVAGGVDAAGYLYSPQQQVIGQVYTDHAVWAFSPVQGTSVYIGYVGHGIADIRFIGGAILLLLVSWIG